MSSPPPPPGLPPPPKAKSGMKVDNNEYDKIHDDDLLGDFAFEEPAVVNYSSLPPTSTTNSMTTKPLALPGKKTMSPSANLQKKHHHQYHHHHNPETGEVIPGKHHTGHHQHKHDKSGAIILGEHEHHYHHQGQICYKKKLQSV